MIRFFAFIFGCLVIASDVRAEGVEWPWWRGPLGTGVAPDADPPLQWDEKTNIKWKVRLPGDRGSSTPVVAGNRIFVLATEDTGVTAKPEDIPKPNEEFQKRTTPPKTYHQFILLCYDRNTGKEQWRQVLREAVPHEGHHPSHSFAGYSPVTDGKHVYAYLGTQGVFCVTVDGDLVWGKQLGRMETRLGWGEGGSPALHGNTLVIRFDHEGDSFVTALNAQTGDPLWRKDRDEVTCWSTPLIVTHEGRTQAILNATGKARSYDLTTGEGIWECAGQTVNAIPTPVADDRAVYVMSGYRGSYAVAIPLGVTGDVTDSDKLLWEHSRGTPYVPSPLLMDGRLYFTQGNTAAFTCLDAKTGEVIIDRERLPAVRDFYASPVGVKDRIYLVGRSGTTLVVKAGTKQVEEMARNPLDDEIDASPVIIGNRIYLRGHRFLYCIE